MEYKDFERVARRRIEATHDTLIEKAKQYARDDRLSNFKRAGEMNRTTAEKALWGMVTKHIIATIDYIDDIDKGVNQPLEQWDEKIGDIIVYMILLEALVNERLLKWTDESS